MNDDQVRQALEEIERGFTQAAIEEVEQGLAHDDPALVKRNRAFCRAETRTVFTVFLLLTIGAVLLTVGAATFSWLALSAGVVAYLISFLVEGRHKHLLRRNRWGP